MNQKQLGVIVLVLSVILLFVVISFTIELRGSQDECPCPVGACPMEAGFPIQTYAGISFVVILGVVGAFMLVKGKEMEELEIKKSTEIKKVIRTLKGDEKKIYEAIADSDGAIFQSELVEKMGFSKVRVTRILDKLEGKGLVERRRRGMTNIVLLKHK